MVVEGMPELVDFGSKKENKESRIVQILRGISNYADVSWMIAFIRSALFLPQKKDSDLKDIAAALVSSEKAPTNVQLQQIERLLALKKDDPIWIIAEALPNLTQPEKDIVWGILGTSSGEMDNLFDAFEGLSTHKRDILLLFIQAIGK